MKQDTKKGFTLVELVVVAVILTILAAVGFVSYENYLVDTRDSKRLTQLAGLRDAMRLHISKGSLPQPDDNVEIRSHGNTFLRQGYAGTSVLETISYSEKTLDPLDEVPYTYMLSRNKKDFQLLGFLEKYNGNVITALPSVYAYIDYSQRFPNVFGKKLGTLLQQDENTPLQEIPEYTASGYLDLQEPATIVLDAYLSDVHLISGTGSDLMGIIPYTTCKTIKNTSASSLADGIYNINPTGLDPFEVYCLMDIAYDGGGWTLVGRSSDANTGLPFGWLSAGGSVRNDNDTYSLGKKSIDLNFSEILLTRYELGKTVTHAIKTTIDRNYIKNEALYEGYTPVSSCSQISPTVAPGDCPSYRYWGKLRYAANIDPTLTAPVDRVGTPRDDGFQWKTNTTNQAGDGSIGLLRGGFNSGFSGQGMIFVR